MVRLRGRTSGTPGGEVNAAKIVTAVITIAMITTLILPDRATPKALDAAFNLITLPLKTAMGK